MLEWIKSLFKKKKRPEPRVVEHRGMKMYISPEMHDMFTKKKIDYETGFRLAVDEVLEEDEDEEEDSDNPYH